MSNLTSELDELLFNQYNQLSLEEVELLKLEEEKPIDSKIIELIGDYNTLKLLLIRQEHKKEQQQLDYDNHYVVLKTGYMFDGMKSTEAKEQAKNDLANTKMEIINTEKQISILKANIHSIEYQLRLKFHQMKLTVENMHEVELE